MSLLSWKEIDFTRTESILKLSGKYEELYSYALFGEIINFHAEELGIDITEDTLQAYSNQARRALRLHKKSDFDEFLNKAQASYDLWESVCENELCRTVLKKMYPGSIEYIPDAWPIIRSMPGVKEAACDIIIAKGVNAGIALSQTDVQEYSDNLRRISGLHKKSSLEEYLNAVNLDLDGWEKMVKAEIYFKELIRKDIVPVTSQELTLNQHISASISAVISELIHGHFIRVQSDKLGISVTDEEIQNYTDDFRRAHGLHSANLFQNWLSANGMSLDDFEIIADLKIRTAKFNQSEKAQVDPEKICKEVRLTISFIDAALKLVSESSIIQKEGISEPTDEELQNESDSLRRVFQLHSAEEFNAYLKRNGLDTECWQDYLQYKLQLKALKKKIATDEKILEYLNSNTILKKTIKDQILDNYISIQ